MADSTGNGIAPRTPDTPLFCLPTSPTHRVPAALHPPMEEAPKPPCGPFPWGHWGDLATEVRPGPKRRAGEHPGGPGVHPRAPDEPATAGGREDGPSPPSPCCGLWPGCGGDERWGSFSDNSQTPQRLSQFEKISSQIPVLSHLPSCLLPVWMQFPGAIKSDSTELGHIHCFSRLTQEVSSPN